MCPLLLLLCLNLWQPVAETIGYTDRDRQMHGPAIRLLAVDPQRGIHAVWKNGYGELRYNFRPLAGSWRWPGGMVANQYPRNLGCLDYNKETGGAVISADYLTHGGPSLAQFEDTTEALGSFAEIAIAPNNRDGLIATVNYGYNKQLAVRNETLFFRGYVGGFRLAYIGPYPTYNFTGCKVGGRYGCVWTANDGPLGRKLYFRQTPNSGQSWYELTAISDSLLTRYSHSLLSGCLVYDSVRPHVVAELYDGANPRRVQLWHFSLYNRPRFSMLHEYSCPDAARFGIYALAADRPSIGLKRRKGECYVVWEQFDPANVEPATGLCRADIWARASPDSGRTWTPAIRLTVPDQTSKRFPFLAEVVEDTLHILYFADRIAGLWENGEGPQTTNPVVYLRVPARMFWDQPGVPVRPLPACLD